MKADAKKADSPAISTIEDSAVGNIKIHENVISSLVRIATLEVPGVARLGGNSLVDGLAEIVGNRRISSSIAVDMSGDNRVAIEVKVNLFAGYNLPEVAENIQKAIVANVENTTGMTVIKTDVIIQGIEQEKPAETEENDTEISE